MAFSLNDLNYEKDSKERMPWEHYTQEFVAADPEVRCASPDCSRFLTMKKKPKN